MSAPRLRATLAAGAALGALAVPATASAHTVSLDGVRTRLTVAPGTTRALVTNGILPLPVNPASATVVTTAAGPTVRYSFPITGGRVDASTLAGRIDHSGGLWFVNAANGRSLKLTRFRIVISSRPGLTAEVNGDPRVRVRILDLNLAHARVTKSLPYVRVANVRASLTATAATALNTTLDTHLFSRGLTLGTANVLARVG